ncbi:YbjN domain-containing protein [Phenylobacterium sp.]|uniref:YbjN domain-containing protein n=1 Tax=Phenylobacterium sp. TaxID=1871053 RepID=UPI002FCABEF9
MKTRLIAMSLAAFVWLGGAAQAAEIAKGGMSVKEVKAWLTDGGYKAEVAKDDAGDEYLKSAAEGVSFDVHFYDCEKARCTSIQMIAGFDMDAKLAMDKVNAWNSKKRYVDCFIDDDGDPWFTYDINLSPGATREALDDNFAVWLSFLPDMKTHIGWD